MNKNNLIKVFYTLMLLICSTSIAAQITFGSLEAPQSGALLQLKNLDNSSNNSPVNADKGLLLPRVDLEDIYNLYPMFPTGYDKNSEDLKHTGLFVYNTNEDLYNGDGAGCYMWDGEKWIGMGMVKRKITINPLNVYISERTPEATAQVTTTPLNFPFKLTTSGKNSSTHTLANGKLTFTINPDISGNKQYKLTMDHSSRSATVNVNHLKLKLAKDVIKSGEGGLISTSAIEADGGDGKWVIKSFTENLFNWTVKPYNDGDNNLCFELGTAKQTGTVKGSITVAHINDPNYTKTIEVWQNKDYIVLPAFDYLVIRYTYPNLSSSSSRVDFDTATELNGTGISTVDNRGVGWSTGIDPVLPGTSATTLMWGGDNQHTGYETVYCNMTVLRQNIPSTSAREFNVDMYGHWYYPKPYGPDDVKVTITLYRGGEMKQGDQNNQDTKYDFFNIGGENVKELTKDGLRVVANYNSTTNALSYRTYYDGLLRLEYDRVDETGLMMRFADIPQTLSSDNIMARSIKTSADDELQEAIRSFEMLPNESKDDFAIRYNQFLKDWNKKHRK